MTFLSQCFSRKMHTYHTFLITCMTYSVVAPEISEGGFHRDGSRILSGEGGGGVARLHVECAPDFFGILDLRFILGGPFRGVSHDSSSQHVDKNVFGQLYLFLVTINIGYPKSSPSPCPLHTGTVRTCACTMFLHTYCMHAMPECARCNLLLRKSTFERANNKNCLQAYNYNSKLYTHTLYI